jgi:tetratricopeptide (TPR) repeat protein
MKSLFSIAFVLFSVLVYAQDPVKDAVDEFKKGEIDKGIKMMNKIVEEDGSNDNWSLLVDMYYYRWDYAKNVASGNLAALIGKTMGADMKEVKYASPATCYEDMIKACLAANNYSQSPRASQIVRTHFIDHNPDTLVTEKAVKEFDTAEDFFEKKDYAKAKQHFLAAIKIDPGYYKATIYAGDMYWYLEDMDSACYYFRKGIAMQPTLLEPRKYLVDALGFQKKNADAFKECLEAIYIYPDQSMFMKMADLVKRNGKKFNLHWIKRGTLANSMVNETKKTNDKTWQLYVDAKKDVEGYCSKEGLLMPSNSVTPTPYLEVYSWEKMLKNSKSLPNEMRFAEQMMKDGYLDCYVLLSMNTQLLYGQYKHFVANNKEKIKKYIETYLIE